MDELRSLHEKDLEEVLEGTVPKEELLRSEAEVAALAAEAASLRFQLEELRRASHEAGRAAAAEEALQRGREESARLEMLLGQLRVDLREAGEAHEAAREEAWRVEARRAEAEAGAKEARRRAEAAGEEVGRLREQAQSLRAELDAAVQASKGEPPPPLPHSLCIASAPLDVWRAGKAICFKAPLALQA